MVRRLRWMLFALGLVAPGLVELRAEQSTGVIQGRVVVAEDRSSVVRRPDLFGSGAPIARPGPDRRPSVVYLALAPRAAFDALPRQRVSMDQRGETFVPRVLAITAGTVVDFPNSDPIYHNVFSLSPTRSFDLGRYEAGRSKWVRFDQPGIVRVFCDIHSHMSAYILVFGHRYFAVTDEQGRYRLDQVPPGSYQVVAWHEPFPSQVRTVTVPDGGGDVELNFELGPE